MNYLKNPRTYLLIIISAFILHSLYFNFVCDDAFISFRYAKNFINGHGLVWNIGEQPPVEGYSNFLWVILIGLFMKMGFEPVVVAKTLSICFGLSNILLSYLFSELIFQRKSFLNLIAPSILAGCEPFAAWSTGGLETQMFAFFVLAAGFFYLYEIKHDKIIPLSAILFALASLTRPEGPLIFGVTCLHRFFHLLLTKKRPFCRKSVIWVLTFVSIYGIYFLWRFNYYGFIFPNTYYAKAGGEVYQFWLSQRGFRYLKRFILFTNWPMLVVLSLLSLFKPPRSTIIYLLMLIISFSWYIVYIGGDFLGMFRFFVPIIPPLAILVQEGIISFSQWLITLIRSTFLKKSAIAFCSFTFILVVTPGLTSFFKGPEYKRILFHQQVVERQSMIGKWLHQHAAPNETLAVVASGALPYYSELTTIDRCGLTDIHIAHTTMLHLGRILPGHGKRDFSYVLSKKPTYFFGQLIFPGNIPPKIKYKLKPAKSEIERFNRLYKPFTIEAVNLKVSLHKLQDGK